MKTLEELCYEVVDYEYDIRPYDCMDTYNSKEEAYNNFYEIMSQEPFNVINEMVEELNMLLKYEDLRDPILKKQYEDGSKLCCELNEYANHFKEISKDNIEI